MSEQSIETPGPEGTELTGESAEDTATTQQENSGHPAWQDILDMLPQEFHSQITPKLQEWDNGVNQRFQSLHSELEPWKPITEQYDPNVVQQALGLLAQIEENPQQVWQTMGEAFGFGTNPGQGTTEQPQPGQQQPVTIEGTEYDPSDPVIARLTQMEGVLGGLADFIKSQQEQESQQKQIAEYNKMMDGLKAKYPGPYDEDVVDALVANGVPPEQAIQRYQTAVKQQAQQMNTPQNTAPVPMGSNNGGSGLPSGQINPGSLSSADTEALVIAMLQADAQSGN